MLQSPLSGPIPSVNVDPSKLHLNSKLLLTTDHKGNHGKGMHRGHKRGSSVRRTSTNASQSQHAASYRLFSNVKWFYETTGCNFLLPALTIWVIVLGLCWYKELKENALDYYYIQYPEQQPVSLIPGTVLPLLPNVWIYDPKEDNHQDAEKKERSGGKWGKESTKYRAKQADNHLRQYQQPHYYMLPQDYYDQQPPSDLLSLPNATSTETLESNTVLEAPKTRGILIVLHQCHQSGLHFFQLPESRIVAAHALQQGLAIFSPTASAASTLLTSNDEKGGKSTKGDDGGGGGTEKNCWSADLDGDELLGPLLFEWSREMKLESLPRMALGIANGANLLITSSLYTTLRLQSMALYGSHHQKGFDVDDLERDVIPATAFVVFPKGSKATEFAIRNHDTLLRYSEQVQEGHEKLQKSEEHDRRSKEDDLEADFSRKALLITVEPHDWTSSLCQQRMPEYRTRCRRFFRQVQIYQKKKARKQELKQMKQDPQQRAKHLRLVGGYDKTKQKFQLLSTSGEILQTSKSPQWIPFMESLGLDDWSTHADAFTLALGNAKTKSRKKKQLSKLTHFPTTATPDGRSWLWASMLQEIEVAYGAQEMTSEHSKDVLRFMLHHAGLSYIG